MYEHPLESVKNKKANIVAMYKGTRVKRIEELPSMVVHPVIKSLKHAVPAALITGTAMHFFNQNKDRK